MPRNTTYHQSLGSIFFQLLFLKDRYIKYTSVAINALNNSIVAGDSTPVISFATICVDDAINC